MTQCCCGEVRAEIKVPPQRGVCLAQLFLVSQAGQSIFIAKLINEDLEHFFLGVQLAVTTGSREDYAMVSAVNEEDFIRKSYRGKQ